MNRANQKMLWGFKLTSNHPQQETSLQFIAGGSTEASWSDTAIEECTEGSSETDEDLMRYFTSRFRDILMFTYKFALKHCALIERSHCTRYFFLLEFIWSSLKCREAYLSVLQDLLLGNPKRPNFNSSFGGIAYAVEVGSLSETVYAGQQHYPTSCRGYVGINTCYCTCIDLIGNRHDMQ